MNPYVQVQADLIAVRSLVVGTSLGSYLPIRSTERQICAAVLHCEGACIGGTMQEALTTPATRTRCARTSTGSPISKMWYTNRGVRPKRCSTSRSREWRRREGRSTRGTSEKGGPRRRLLFWP